MVKFHLRVSQKKSLTAPDVMDTKLSRKNATSVLMSNSERQYRPDLNELVVSWYEVRTNKQCEVFFPVVR
jgi:hypothetical protein